MARNWSGAGIFFRASALSLPVVPEEFAAALKAGKSTDGYDDALYHYAKWMMNNGRGAITADGGWRQEQDFVKALELFRRLTGEFKKGETRYFDQANSYIENITKPSLSVNTSNVFLPDSEIQFYLQRFRAECSE